MPRRRLRGRRATVAVVGCLACALAFAIPADAANVGPTPLVNCVAVSADGSSATAFFGYTDTDTTAEAILIGSDNLFSPAPVDEGQPTTFNPGTVPRAVSVTFNPTTEPAVTWLLNGQQATATTGSPHCGAGTTSPASDVTDSSATLNGVINPDGTGTSYTFEYGTTAAYGNITPVADAGAGFTGTVVQAALAGLAPSTTYFFRLDTTASTGGVPVTSYGGQQQFTTAGTAAPAPTVTVTATPAPAPTVTVTATPAPAPTVTVTATPSPAPTVTVTVTPPVMTLLTTALPAGRTGAPYLATLSATGGTTPYTWLVTDGALPPGLRLDGRTGVISGRPLRACSSRVTISVTDSSRPARESLSEQYTIAIAR